MGVLETSHEGHHQWEVNNLENMLLLEYDLLHFVLHDLIFLDALQSIQVATSLTLLHQEHFPELALTQLPYMNQTLEFNVRVVQGLTSSQFHLFFIASGSCSHNNLLELLICAFHNGLELNQGNMPAAFLEIVLGYCLVLLEGNHLLANQYSLRLLIN